MAKKNQETTAGSKPQMAAPINVKPQQMLIAEVAWEVCNQVGGIYTVIRSKVPEAVNRYGENYLAVGPYIHKGVSAEFDPIDDYDHVTGKAVLKMREAGFEVHYGRWLITGSPKVVLFNPYQQWDQLANIKYRLWEHHGINCPAGDNLFDQTAAFGELVRIYFGFLCAENAGHEYAIIAHFHEWLAATPIPSLRRENLPLKIVFTTHATLLGRYLAMHDAFFYDHLPYFDWVKEAIHFNVEGVVKVERAAAHGAHVFSTVSEVTARECLHLLGRQPDVIMPNGLNLERFTALHEFQNLHKLYKDKIHEFVMGHFFHSYSFDLDKTVYFFISGRFEFRNKGFDITLDALAKLNWKMQLANLDTTVVMFIVTKRPFSTMNPSVLQSRAILEEIRETCKAIEEQVGSKLFSASAAGSGTTLPDLNEFVDDYWRMRLRRTIQNWKSNQLPLIVTHNLIHDAEDEVLNSLRSSGLFNHKHQKVKVVYHPDFISSSNPLFGMDYTQFVRGCHLGVFPSYYEPWGYTPLECIASGVPTITSDLSGFGDYVLNTMPEYEENGIYVNRRRYQSYHDAAEELSDQMLRFVKQSRRDRIAQRNKTERASVYFDWEYLYVYYSESYEKAMKL
jgi:glycogen(starch) synthase